MATIRIGAGLALSLTGRAERITKTVRPVIDRIKRKDRLIVAEIGMAVMLAQVVAALIATDGILFGPGTVFSALAGMVSGVGQALGMIATILNSILFPVGLVLAAIVSRGGYPLYVSGAGQKTLAWVER